MAKVYIFTVPGDLHVTMIRLGLRMLGHETLVIFTSEFASRQKMSLIYNENRVEEKISFQESGKLDPSGTVWLRRLFRPRLSDNLKGINLKHCIIEFDAAIKSLYYQLSLTNRCISPYESVIKAECKGLQLTLAKKAGLLTPDTLISNDVESVRKFIYENPENSLIKPFSPLCWDDGEGNTRAFFATKIQEKDLDKDIFANQPSIFQRIIEKKYDIRCVFFGDFCVAGKLYSKNKLPSIDYKEYPGGKLYIEPHKLPPHIRKQCVVFLRNIGLTFGVIDFVVDEADNYFFLEVNAAGQFLFLEQECPELRLLDTMCQFLTDKEDSFCFSKRLTAHRLRYSDFFDEAREITKNEIQERILPRNAWEL